jgi:hypothetical protein
MSVEATVTEPIPTEPVTPPAAAATVAPVLLGAEAAAVTADQAAATEASKIADQAKAVTDAKTATDAQAAADAKTAADAKAALGAPEKYEFKAPEGQTYDPNLMGAFEAAAKDANMPQDAAQKLLDSMAPKIAERQTEQVLAIRREWFEASKADKDFGGDKLEANLATAKKALDTFGSPELNKLLVSTGLGNHPEIIRMMFKAGKALSEDTFVAGRETGAAKPSITDVLYDKTPAKG